MRNDTIQQEQISGDAPAGRRGETVTVVVLTAFATSFTGSSLNLSIPSISGDFHTSAALVGWMVTVYALAVAAFSVPFGRIADITSRKAVLVIGTAGFAACCGLSAAAPSFPLLLVLRFLQGVFGSMIFSTNTAIIIAAFPLQMRGKAIGYALGGTYVGLSSGPVIGGIMNQHLGWRSIFFFTCILSVLAFLLALLRLPSDRSKGRRRPLDLTGNILFIVFIVSFMYGLSQLAGSPLTAAVLVAAGLASGVLFLRHEDHQEDPAVNVRLFRNSLGFSLSNLSALLNYSATSALSYLVSIYLQVVQGYPSQTAGLIMVCQPVIMAIFSPRFGRLSDRISPFRLSSLGMAVTGLGTCAFLFAGANTPTPVIVCALLVIGFGFAMFSSPNTNAIMSFVDRKDHGVASSLVSTMRTIGQTTGMVIVTITASLFLGSTPLASADPALLILVIHVSMGIVAFLCGVGVLLSLQRGQKHSKSSIALATLIILTAVLLFVLGTCSTTDHSDNGETNADTLVPEFSLKAGFYQEDEIALALSAPSGCRIYYTLDGSEPDQDDLLYRKPLAIASPFPSEEDLAAPGNAQLQFTDPDDVLLQDPALPAGTTVRAVVYDEAGHSGSIVTQTYFTGISLPDEDTMVLSLVTDDRELLDHRTGIMVKGAIWDEWIRSPESEALSEKDRIIHASANFSQHGRKWERPASVEIFDRENGTYIQEDAGIRIHGNSSRNAPQKSFAVFFREKYGSSCLTYDLLETAVNSEGETIHRYGSFLLRNGGNDRKYLRFKDALLLELLAGRDFDCQAARPAVVFLNGEYWGIYTLCEKYSESYFEQHYPGINGDNVVVIKEGEVDEGDAKDLALYEALLEFADRDLAEEGVWQDFKRAVDIQSMADYYAAEIYIGNADWEETKNTTLWRVRKPSVQEGCADGRWRFIVSDTEFSSSLYGVESTSAAYDSVRAAMKLHPLFAAAMHNREFRELFLSSLRETGTTCFDPDTVQEKLDEYAAQWKPFVLLDDKRFGPSIQRWDPSIEGMQTFFEERYPLIMAYAQEVIRELEET